MSLKQTGPVEVRPNTLRDQRVPNTFRVSTASGAPAGGPPGGSRATTGTAPSAPKRAVRLPQIPLWAYLLAVLFVVFVVSFLLNEAP